LCHEYKGGEIEKKGRAPYPCRMNDRSAAAAQRFNRLAAYIFLGALALALAAFPFVRDIALFEQVYTWICAPFL